MKESATKWWVRKLALLAFLLLQFYLAKRLDEPYPCIIMPSFAQAYPAEELPAAITYTFFLVDSTKVDTLTVAGLFPFVPPNYEAFTAEHLFTLSEREEQAWQLLLKDQLQLSSSRILRMEQWANTLREEEVGWKPIQNCNAIREIRIDDGVPQYIVPSTTINAPAVPGER